MNMEKHQTPKRVIELAAGLIAKEAERRFAPVTLLAEAVALLKEMHDRWGNVHDSDCAMIKSGRRKWGRIEPCSCTMGVRRMKFEAFMARYSANAQGSATPEEKR